MSSSNDKPTPPTDRFAKRRQQTRRLLVLMLLALLLLWLFQWRLGVFKEEQIQAKHQADSLVALAAQQAQQIHDSLRIADSLRQAGLLNLADSLHVADSLRMADSLASLAQKKGRVTGEFKVDSAAMQKRTADSLNRADSLAKAQRVADSLKGLADLEAQKLADPNPPSPALVPPPGRYYQSITLRVDCGEPKCITEISLGDSLNPKNGQTPFAYNTSGAVFYRATDSLGNVSSWQKGVYDMAGDNRCPANAYPVPVKGKTVCVDAYEYPNQAGEKPKAMVTHEMAARLCSEAGKRLCTIDEWQAGCKGKDNTRYAYGNRYQPSKCVTAAREALRSGYAEQCRSWWGMYDMAGNLWEWTASPAPQRSSLYLVAGGSWNTQNASSCTETKFSFYPQNEYTFVGFRCCSDTK